MATTPTGPRSPTIANATSAIGGDEPRRVERHAERQGVRAPTPDRAQSRAPRPSVNPSAIPEQSAHHSSQRSRSDSSPPRFRHGAATAHSTPHQRGEPRRRPATRRTRQTRSDVRKSHEAIPLGKRGAGFSLACRARSAVNGSPTGGCLGAQPFYGCLTIENESRTTPRSSRNFASSRSPLTSITRGAEQVEESDIAGWSSVPPEICPELPATV